MDPDPRRAAAPCAVEIVVTGGNVATGHDPDTGDELWRWGTWNPQQITHWRLVPTAVASDGVILACAPKKDPIYAVKAGGKGRLSDDALAWVSTDDTDVSSDVPTPAFYDGDFFVLSDVRKSLSRVEPKSGKVKWTVRTPGRDKYEASPLVADGKVYALNFAGAVAVFDTENGKLLSENEMGNQERHPVRSSVIAAHGQIFVRTNNALYCID